jgi:hypothetical protein
MGLPTTLAGIAGFLIFVVLIIGMSASDLYPNETAKIQQTQDNYLNALNISTNTSAPAAPASFWDNPIASVLNLVGLDGIYTAILNFFGMIITFIVMMVGSLFLFMGIASTIPAEVAVFFAIIASSAIIAIVKLIFLSGE